MKAKYSLLLIILFLLPACAPGAPASPEITPVAIEGCLITPHDLANQAEPVPHAVFLHIPGSEGLNLVWRDGSSLGTWQTGSVLSNAYVHLAGSASEAPAVPLAFLGGDKDGLSHLYVSLAGQVESLIEFDRSVTVTGLTGIPGMPVLAYSTVKPLADGSGLLSQIFLGDIESIAAAAPVHSMESSEARIILPVAIHRDLNELPDGLWYTTSPWGIGGDSLVDPRAGLYYLDLKSGEVLEFLDPGCSFSDLAVNQNRAAWSANGILYVSDLHSGGTVSFTRLPGNDRGPVHAFIGPGDGLIAWLEGKGSEWDGSLETILRIGSLAGNIIGEYPLPTFSAAADLGDEIVIVPLGWMAAENFNLVLAVYNAPEDQAVLISLDANSGQISRLSEGVFAGFAYP